VALWYNWKYEK